MEAANAALTLQTESYAVNRFFQGSCCAPSPADDLTLDVTVTDEVEPEEPEQKTAPPKGHLLRICVHHGLDLPRHETQLEVVKSRFENRTTMAKLLLRCLLFSHMGF